MNGLEQVEKGRVKDFNMVCNKLEKKYQDVPISNQNYEFLAEIGVRKDYYRNYKIYYVVREDIVYVIRILHMLVDSKAWMYRTFGLQDQNTGAKSFSTLMLFTKWSDI